MIVPTSQNQVLAPDPLSPRTRLEREEDLMQRKLQGPQPPRGIEVNPKDTSNEMPSEANLLMALAEMHKQGRFQVAGDVVPFNKPTPTYGPGTDWDALSQKNKALATQSTLSRALGRSNVIPIRPEDK